MGKKSNAGGGDAPKATAFVLKVPMHCRCKGCGDKIRAAVRDLPHHCDYGIVSLDQSALDTKGEVAIVATADPERLRRRLRKATGKDVGLVFPKPPAAKAVSKAPDAGKDDAAAAVQAALLNALRLQQQQAVQHAYHGHPLSAGTWNAHQHGEYAYPWPVLQQQAPPPEPYYLPSYPATAWGAYPHGGGGGWPGY